MILTGPAIQGAVDRGEINIDPFDPARLNPASYDLELGELVSIYTPEESTVPFPAMQAPTCRRILDSARRQNVTVMRMTGDGFIVEPGNLYLMHTRERIHTRGYVPIIDGKSSIGRLGLLVHVTAGYGDPGFNGQYTLEVVALAHPVIVYPGMRFAQMRFHAMQGRLDPYRGNYTGEDAMGPVRSASWRQFVALG